MTLVKSEGTEFRIVNPNEALERDLGNLSKFVNGADTRIAFFRGHFPPYEEVPYVLVWQDKVDLSELHTRVQKGEYTDLDFEMAFRALQRNLVCNQCGKTVESLVIDAGDPYPNNDDLHRQKIERLVIKKCPFCQASMRQLVVKCV